ncbi:MAG: dethiobiotin synthase [Planctomycetota bacterium]|nr:dethiobiotin synthase [Planctomycetota bacterium]
MKEKLPHEIQGELASWEAAGLKRVMEPPKGIDFTTNDYLGLSGDSRIRDAAAQALSKFGPGAPASRLLRGHLPPHENAEKKAADWCGDESALLFSSGWQANQAILSSFAQKGDIVFSDELNHASLIDGCRISDASVRVFLHNNLQDLERQLSTSTCARRRFVVVEHVYSMDGDLAPLEELASLCELHDAWLIVDEAHAAGLYPFFQHDRLFLRMITGGKALGLGGGFVCGSKTAIDLLINRGRSFVFTTASSPVTASALSKAIELVQAEPERAEAAHRAAKKLRDGLSEQGIETRGSSPIVPVVLRSESRALKVAQTLQNAGFDIRAIRPPTVPAGTSRLRIVCHANHKDSDIENLCSILAPLAQGVDNSKPEPVTERRLVVCGTDTDVGKTVVSALLVRAAQNSCPSVRYFKPVQTGEDSDTQSVSELAELPEAELVSPVVQLRLPASVDQAAEAERVSVTVEQVHLRMKKTFGAYPNHHWIVETAGGLLVPFNRMEDQSQLLQRLNAPGVLVARSGLGTLNHTLLSLEAARSRGIEIRALFLVGEEHSANFNTLNNRLGTLPIFQLPHFVGGPSTARLDSWLENNSLEFLFHDNRLAEARL